MNAIITIDSREPQHIKKLTWDSCISQVATLEYGDFEILCDDGAKILVERKTPSDFLGSIKDGRLTNQVSGLVSSTQWAYLLIESQCFDDIGAWSWQSIQGQLLSVQEQGCAVVYDPDTHGAIARLINRSRGDVKVLPRREAYVFSPKEQVLMSLPGIGNKKALEYLELFNDNVALALTALTAEDDKDRIPGWGKKSRDNLVELLGCPVEAKI